MAATGKEGITLFLVRLYTSLIFWGGLLLLFFLTFFIISSADGAGLYGSLYTAGFALAMMPMVAYLIIPKIWALGYTFPIVVWILELGAIAWLRFKSAKLGKRTIVIIGSVVLLLLVTQFVSCTILIISGLGFS